MDDKELNDLVQDILPLTSQGTGEQEQPEDKNYSHHEDGSPTPPRLPSSNTSGEPEEENPPSDETSEQEEIQEEEASEDEDDEDDDHPNSPPSPKFGEYFSYTPKYLLNNITQSTDLHTFTASL